MKRNLFLLMFLPIFLYAQNKPKVLQYKLDNGFTVILCEDHSKPKVVGMTITKVGSKHDPKDATGLAHYQEHMLFKGTEEIGTTNWEKEKVHIDKIFALYDTLATKKDEKVRKSIQMQINEESLKANEYAIPNDFSNIVKSIGGDNLNAYTSNDRTVYLNDFPPNQIERWLDIYSHRIMKPVFRGFQSELEVVYEEKNLYSDRFESNMFEALSKNFYKNHPYGQQTTIGTIEHLKNPSLTKMYNFFKTYYVANNMGLVLVGDFNTEEVMPMIKEKFGRLQIGVIPEFPKYEEAPFKGREQVNVRLTPIKVGILGFRTVPSSHNDALVFDIINYILSNQNQTGLLDKLMIDNKLIAAQAMNMIMKDHGGMMFLIVPKIMGQKLEEAEKLVLDEIKNLKNGNFPDWMLDAAKYETYKSHELNMESIDNKAYILSEAFGEGLSIDDALQLPERVKKISKEDVIRVANTYFGENYMAFFSKMGFPKNEKIEKPGFKPVLSKNETKSIYNKYLESIKFSKFNPTYIDFEKDIQTQEIQKGYTLFNVKNNTNDIFQLKVKYKQGELSEPMLKYVEMIIGSYSGTENFKVSEFKSEFSKIGCTYSLSVDDNYTTITIEGIEKNFEAAVKLVNQLISKPKLEADKVKTIVENEKTARKMEDAQADEILGALQEYVLYGEKSNFIDRLSMSEIKKLTSDTLVHYFKNATKYEAEFHYYGSIDISEISNIIKKNITLNANPISNDVPKQKVRKDYNAANVFFVNKKNTIQSKIGIYTNLGKYNNNEEGKINAFNLYFSGDFSGLVLQEIREYRSLAYGAGANIYKARKSGDNNFFMGFVSTQSDKSMEALDVFDTLIHFMPEKPERWDMLKTFLQQTLVTEKPDMRNLSEQVVRWKWRGYTQEPAKILNEKYESMSFADIVSFYKENIQKKPLVTMIVADKKRMKNTDLSKYGLITEKKIKDLYKK